VSARFCLDGRVALVTGGNGGLGLAMARALRDAGATVVVAGRDPAKNAAVAGEFETVALDVRDDDRVNEGVGSLVTDHGQLDILVNNAGVYRDQSMGDFIRADWDDMIATNLTGAVVCARSAAVAMRASGGGKVINVGSMYSVFGHPGSVGYAASKAGVIGATRALACELAPHHIQVNAILPGWFPTAMNGTLPAEGRGTAITRRTPAGRWGDLDDLAGPVVFLASAASDFVTGVCLPVDGGYLVSDREAGQ
jgi:2-deoxy-D-gluconate 3-dehydrogenase